MPIPSLTLDGLLPPGRHSATEDEVRAAFVDAYPTSGTRADLFVRWLEHRRALELILGSYRQWVNGSFVTAKTDPGDIDVVTSFDPTAIRSLLPREREALGTLLDAIQARAAYCCHSFYVPLYPLSHPERPLTDAGERIWDGLWSSVSPKPPFGAMRFRSQHKGYLELK